MNIKKIISSKWFLGFSLMTICGIANAEPVTAFIGAFGSYIGMAVSAISVISSAQQQKKASEYNSAMATQQAAAANQVAAANAERQQRTARAQIGGMEAQYAASGISMEGSPIEILEQSAREAELDRMNIIYGGQAQAAGYQRTAALESAKASNAMASGYLKAGSSILGGLSSSSTSYGRAGVDTGSYGNVYDTEMPETSLWRAS